MMRQLPWTVIVVSKTCYTMAQLEREIAQRANDALENEIGDYVVDRLKKHVVLDVYAMAEPVAYNRRENHGGLKDTRNIRRQVKNRTLNVFEEAPLDGPRFRDKTGISKKPDALARVLEAGPYNPFTPYKDYSWMRPRPFMDYTQEDINEHDDKIIKMLKRHYYE